MKVRKSRSVTIDEVSLAELRGAIIHPDLYREYIKALHDLELKGKLCLLPTTILERYHMTMPDRVALFEESCRQRFNVLSSY